MYDRYIAEKVFDEERTKTGTDAFMETSGVKRPS